MKCTACHKRDEKYVGPALAGVTERRSAAYIMNMILNPQEMVERHPIAKQLLAEHMSFMPAQGLTENEARDDYANPSPDDARYVFVSNRDGDFELYVMDRDGANIRRITDTPGVRENVPDW